LIALPGFGIDERHASRFARVLIDCYLIHSGVRPKRQIPGILSRANQTCWRIESCVNITAADVPVACTAAPASASVFVVLQPVGRHSSSIRRQDTAHAFERFPHMHFGRAQLNRTLKLSVRDYGIVLRMSRYAQVKVYFVV